MSVDFGLVWRLAATLFLRGVRHGHGLSLSKTEKL